MSPFGADGPPAGADVGGRVEKQPWECLVCAAAAAAHLSRNASAVMMDGTTQHLSAYLPTYLPTYPPTYLPTYLPLYTAATRQLKENSGAGKSSDQRRKFPRCMYAARVRPMPYLLQYKLGSVASRASLPAASP
jgi:hypothetical protein